MIYMFEKVFITAIVIVIAGFAIKKFANSNSNNLANSSNNINTSKQIENPPTWLINELEKFYKLALSYALYEISQNQKLSENAQKKKDSLSNFERYSPPPLLLTEVVIKNDCVVHKLREYLAIYYQNKTGKFIEANDKIVDIVEKLLQKQANNEANRLQNS